MGGVFWERWPGARASEPFRNLSVVPGGAEQSALVSAFNPRSRAPPTLESLAFFFFLLFGSELNGDFLSILLHRCPSLILFPLTTL